MGVGVGVGVGVGAGAGARVGVGVTSLGPSGGGLAQVLVKASHGRLQTQLHEVTRQLVDLLALMQR